MAKNIENWILTFISDREMYVLRQRKTLKPLNVSYSPEGLQWTMGNYGNLLCFKDAYIDRSNSKQILIKGDTRMSKDVFIEKFIPMNHTNSKLQYLEYVWVHKALKMLYNNDSILKH